MTYSKTSMHTLINMFYSSRQAYKLMKKKYGNLLVAAGLMRCSFLLMKCFANNKIASCIREQVAEKPLNGLDIRKWLIDKEIGISRYFSH